MTRNGRAGLKRDATHETPVTTLLETRIREIEGKHRSEPPIPTLSLLTSKLGLGDRPAIRRALYRKIEACCRAHGRPASKIVWSALYRSANKTNGARWFCCVAVDELCAAGLLATRDET